MVELNNIRFIGQYIRSKYYKIIKSGSNFIAFKIASDYKAWKRKQEV